MSADATPLSDVVGAGRASRAGRTGVDAGYAHCAEVLRASGSSFAAAFWMLSRPQRRALQAIYAFCRLADDIADDPRVAGDRRALLERWSGELDLAYEGRPETTVGVALADAVDRHALPKAWLGDLLAGIRIDLEGRRLERFEDVEHYCYCVASTVGLCVVAVLGERSEAVTRFAIDQGIAVQLTNILRDVGSDARAGRIYLAAEDLAHFGVREAEIGPGESGEALQVVLAAYAARARLRYDRALAQLGPATRRRLRPALAMGAIYRALLDRMMAAGVPCTAEPLRLSRPRRLAIAARVWMGASTP